MCSSPGGLDAAEDTCHAAKVMSALTRRKECRTASATHARRRSRDACAARDMRRRGRARRRHRAARRGPARRPRLGDQGRVRLRQRGRSRERGGDRARCVAQPASRRALLGEESSPNATRSRGLVVRRRSARRHDELPARLPVVRGVDRRARRRRARAPARRQCRRAASCSPPRAAAARARPAQPIRVSRRSPIPRAR